MQMVCHFFHQAAISMLKQEYKEGEVNLESALELAIKVLSKTLDTNKLTPEKGQCKYCSQNILCGVEVSLSTHTDPIW